MRAEPAGDNDAISSARRITLEDLPLEAIREVARRYQLRELSVFGSVANGTARGDSDLDLLYVCSARTPSGLAFLTLADELATVVGRPVDLVSRNHLHWVLRDRVLAEARVLYAA